MSRIEKQAAVAFGEYASLTAQESAAFLRDRPGLSAIWVQIAKNRQARKGKK
jgi:hypothetical protein